MNSDFKELLKKFNANEVKYLIVGGYAVAEHNVPRYTKDLDIWVKADNQNAKRVFVALHEFGAPLFQITETTFAEEGYFYRMGRPPVQVDVLMSVKGLKFEDAWSNRFETSIDGVSAMFISKQDLITAKLISGRSQDLVDAENLQKAPSSISSQTYYQVVAQGDKDKKD